MKYIDMQKHSTLLQLLYVIRCKFVLFCDVSYVFISFFIFYTLHLSGLFLTSSEFNECKTSI